MRSLVLWETYTREEAHDIFGSSLFGVAYGDCDVSVVTVLGS